MVIAITREVSPSIQSCELTHLKRVSIDYKLACEQHQCYEDLLKEQGCHLIHLQAEVDLPDSVFVEDTAVVLNECAILTRPALLSRRPEVKSIEDVLKPYRNCMRINTPGTLDGGDVLVLNKTIYIGLSSRTNKSGIEQVRQIGELFGYRVVPVPVHNCLHLKSGVSRISDHTLLINPDWIDPKLFPPHAFILTHPEEPFAANALCVGQSVIYPAAYPKTRERLEQKGVSVRQVDVSELGKAEGGVTCCSLIFQGQSKV
jgi:dimethylargininase